MRYLIIALTLACALSAFAGDIVTMPTANQLKKGEVDVAAYYLNLDTPPAAPNFVNYQTLYVGVTDKIEFDLHAADVDKDKESFVVVASYKLLSETADTPDLVVGVRNLAGTETTTGFEKSGQRSYYLAMAKTFFEDTKKPGPPLVRAHLALGTADYTLLGEKRHEGIFGGLQFLFGPTVGGVVEYDGNDLITGVTLMPANTGLTLKGGTYGRNTWLGLSWNKTWF